MRKLLKAGCSLLLVLTMIFNLMPFALAANDAQVSGILYVNTPVSVSVTEEQPNSYFYFIPEESGRYSFSSSGYLDTYGYILDEYWNEIQRNDDDGDNGNFKVTAELTAGETYILQSRLYSYGAGSYSVSITAAPVPQVASITATPISIIENMGGWSNGDYYYYYIQGSHTEVTVTLTDGTVLTNKDKWQINSGISYNNDWYAINISLPQSAESPLLVGNTYEATISVLGATGSLPVTIEKNPVKSIEICDVASVDENDYLYIENGAPVYATPDFNFKVLFTNGEQVVLKSDAEYVQVETNQHQFPWKVGGLNIVTVSYLNVSTQFNVELKPNNSVYEYIVQDDELYITACYATEEELTVPSEIDGLPVKGILSLSPADGNITALTIPDNVTYIAQGTLNGWDSRLEKVHLGAGIAEIDWKHFADNESLYEITVDSKNPNYAALDGILYDKTLSVLVYYPFAKGDTYTVPASVTDITVLNMYYHPGLNIVFESGNDIYVTIDGVTYTKDMKKVISCDPDKTGEYVMPESVESIAEYAFSGSNLSKVTVSSSVTEITYSAFSSSALKEIQLPDGLKSIDRFAFMYSDVESIELPQSLTYIGPDAFYKSELTAIQIPGSVQTFGERAFAYCEDLAEITIDEGVTQIGGDTFYGAGQNAEKVTVSLPNTLTVIGDDTFASANIYEIEIPNGVTTIGNSAFARTKLTTIAIPASVTTIGESAFSETNLTGVVIPDTVTSLGSSAFAYTQLQSFTIGTGIDYIPDSCFRSILIAAVTIPSHIINIDDYAFAFCSNLKTVTLEGENVNVGYGAFHDCPIELVNLDALGKMDDYAFYGNNITDLVVPENVTEIAYAAFAGSNSLKTIDLPDTIEKVGGRAFHWSPWYNQQSNDWVYVDDVALYGYKGDIWTATAPQIPEGILVLGDYSMENSTFNAIALPDTLRTIGEYAFHDNKNLKALHIPENVKNIYANAFEGCDSLTALTVDEDNPYFTAVDNALYNKDMTELILCLKQKTDVFMVPESVTKIHSGAFETSDIAYIVFENGDVELFEDSLLCTKRLPGLVIENYMPTIACKQNTDTAVYNFAKSNMYYTVPLSNFVEEPEYSGKAGILGNSMVCVGDTIELIVDVADCDDTTSVAVVLNHSDCFELVSTEWLQAGSLKTFDTDILCGALGGLENANINGNLFKIVLKANEEIENAEISVQVIAKNDDTVVMDTTATKTIDFGMAGDLNDDGKVTDADATYLLMHTFFPSTYSVAQDCDFNDDGKVTDADAVHLLMYTFFPGTYPIA